MDIHPIYQICPHGMQPPYCPQCVTEDLAAKYEKEREEQTAQRVREENKQLRATVANQTAALDAAHAQIRNLQKRRQRGLPWRRQQ
jgi:hypothetical protein